MNKKLKKKEKTNSKGITLIALVITIIVLLILAGVTINLTLGENGIFKTAEMAGKNYTQAQEDELAGLAGFENTINNIIAGTGNNEGSGTDTPVVKGLLKDIALPGNYVKYDTGIEGIGENGDGIVLFRVLYNDDTYGLQIISAENVEQVTLGTDGENDLAAFQSAMQDYNNAIATLNQKAERYAENSPYAIDGRCVGSVPTVGTDGTFNAKNNEVSQTYSISDEWTLPSGWSSRDTGCRKGTDTNYKTDYDTMEGLHVSGVSNILTTGEEYWFASRGVNSSSSRFNFVVRYVPTSGSLSFDTLCYMQSNGYTRSDSFVYGLRPCISLRSDVKVIGGGDGSEATPYELGI